MFAINNKISNSLYIKNTIIDKIYLNNNVIYDKSARDFTIKFTIKETANKWALLTKLVFILDDGTALQPNFTVVSTKQDANTKQYTDIVKDQNGYTYTVTAIGKYGNINYFQGFDKTLYNKTSSAYDIDSMCFYNVTTPFDCIITTNNYHIIGIMLSLVCPAASGWSTAYSAQSLTVNDINYVTHSSVTNCVATEKVTGNDGNEYVMRHIFIKNDNGDLDYYKAWTIWEVESTNKFKTYYKDILTNSYIEESNILTLINTIGYDKSTGLGFDTSALTIATIQFGNNVTNQPYSSLNLGAIYDSNGKYLADLSTKISGTNKITNSNFELLQSDSNIVYLENNYENVNGEISNLINSNYKSIVKNTTNNRYTLKVGSNTTKYLAISPLSNELITPAASAPLDVTAYEHSDYYRFSISGGITSNMLERFLINLKDGTQLRYLGYNDEVLNKKWGTETFKYSMTAIFTRDQSIPGITTKPAVVTYDPSDKKLVAIRVIAKNSYNNNNTLKYSFMPVSAYDTLSIYGALPGGTTEQNFWLCFPDDSNLSIDEIESFTISNHFESNKYKYTVHGFTKLSYRRIDIDTQSELDESVVEFTDAVDNFRIPAISAKVKITGESSSTYLSVDNNKIINVDSIEALNIQDTKVVNGVKYISRYLIDIETKKYTKCWIQQQVNKNDISNPYIYYSYLDTMLTKKVTDIITNIDSSGEVHDEIIAKYISWRINILTDRGTSGSYYGFGHIYPVINGKVYECTVVSREDNVQTITNPIYCKLKAVADASNETGRLAYVNKTASSLTTNRTVDDTLDANTMIADDEIIVATTFNNRYNNGLHYLSEYAFTPIKITSTSPLQYLLFLAKADAYCNYQLVKIGQNDVDDRISNIGLDGLIIIPRGRNGTRMCFHNKITVSGGNYITDIVIENEISGTKIADFVLNRAFYANLSDGTVTQIN